MLVLFNRSLVWRYDQNVPKLHFKMYCLHFKHSWCLQSQNLHKQRIAKRGLKMGQSWSGNTCTECKPFIKRHLHEGVLKQQRWTSTSQCHMLPLSSYLSFKNLGKQRLSFNRLSTAVTVPFCSAFRCSWNPRVFPNCPNPSGSHSSFRSSEP